VPVAALVAGSVAVAQAAGLASGAARFSPDRPPAVSLALWFGLALASSVWLVEVTRRRPLSRSARVAAVVSVCACYLKLIVLLHPDKAAIDAVFHAHRFEWVLAGRYYFTQLSTNATPFPYAIGLYLFAAPWALLTSDHVTLLRIVVCSTEAIAGGLLYLMVARAWSDRLAGVAAVALFNLVPASCAALGFANLTNAFGQSVAVATMGAVWALRRGHLGRLLGLILLATLAFLSHIGTFVVLLAALLTAAVLDRWTSRSRQQAIAGALFLATVAAVILSTVLYWGHFGEVYKAQIVRTRVGAAAGAAPSAASPPATGTPVSTPVAAQASSRSAVQRLATVARLFPGNVPPAGLSRVAIPLPLRAVDAIVQTLASIGWPILVLACVGAWRLVAERVWDRLVLILASWGVTYLALAVLGVLTPVNVRYQQDAWEFLGRLEYATSPAAVILAARGAAWAWRAGAASRFAAAVLVGLATTAGAVAWLAWL
jgi:hypothetical protein